VTPLGAAPGEGPTHFFPNRALRRLNPAQEIFVLPSKSTHFCLTAIHNLNTPMCVTSSVLVPGASQQDP